nr:ABC transporter substrate-binding protein [uncultured Acetatifactor sp.]
MKKRLLTKILALAMSAVLLTACGSGDGGNSGSAGSTSESSAEEQGGEQESSSEEENQESQDEQPAAAGDAVTIRMTYITGGVEPDGLDRVEAALNEQSLAKIGCNIELVPVAHADEAATYNKWFASGEDVDIICTVFQDYLSMINAGGFQPLDDLIAEYGKDMLEKDKEKSFLGAGRYKGQLYGIPTIPSAPGNGGALYIRKDVLDQLDTEGIDLEGYIGYEELDSLLSQIYEKFPEYTALGVSGKDRTKSNFFFVKNYDNLGVGESSGVVVDALNDTTVENLYATEEYREYLDWMRKWYQAGYISKDAATSDESGGDLFDAGKAATCIGMSTPGTRENTELESGTEVVQIDLCPTWMTTNVYTGVLFFIPTNAKNPEKAMEVLNLLFTDGEFSNVLANGVEGEDYTITDAENGVIEFNGSAEKKYTNMFGVWGDGAQWYISPPTTPDIYQQREDYLAETVAHTSKVYGYKFDASSVETEQSTVKNVIAKYLTQLEYGTVDVDTVLPEFLNDLENAGMSTIIEENQRQLDEWLAGQ